MTPRNHQQTAERVGALVRATPSLVTHTARILRKAADPGGKRLDLWPQPGSGARTVSYSPGQMANLLLALVLGEPIRGPDLVAGYRGLRCNVPCAELPGSTFGECLDGMVMGRVRYPTQIILITIPYIAAGIVISTGDGYRQAISFGEQPFSTCIYAHTLSGGTVAALSTIWKEECEANGAAPSGPAPGGGA